MRFSISIWLFFISSTLAFPQTDTTASDTIQAGINAPESLQKLIQRITSKEEADSRNDVEIEIDGLLFDETLTKSGRDFYDIFYNNWNAPSNSKNYSIFIKEKPFRMFTTIIEVKINETLVFQSVLQPRYAYIESLTQQAINQVGNILANYDELVKQLDGEDKSGSGIF